MKYIYVNVEGWLTGTIFQSMTKGEGAIWHELCMIAGIGKGRYGYIEKAKGLGYERSELLNLCNCFSAEDINLFDSCIKKCVDGVQLGKFFDEPRMVVEDNGVYKILNWNKYQHPDYPQGYTEDEAKAIIKERRKARQATKGTQTEKELDAGYAAAEHAKKAMEINPVIATRIVTDINKKIYGNLGNVPDVDMQTGELTQNKRIETSCKCNECGGIFITDVGVDEERIKDDSGKFIIDLTCSDCRNKESLGRIQPKEDK